MLKKLVIFFFLFIILLAIAFRLKPGSKLSLITTKKTPIIAEPFNKFELFKSDQDFKDYLSRNMSGTSSYRNEAAIDVLSPDRVMMNKSIDSTMQVEQMAPAGLGEEEKRVSETNVQVLGIDEPDIVKTNGNDIYYSSYNLLRKKTTGSVMNSESGIAVKELDSRYVPPQIYESGTAIIKAFPPEKLNLESKINKIGDLLRYKDTLVVLTTEGIFAYDVSDATDPKEKWSLKYKQDYYLRSEARLDEGQLIVVNRRLAEADRPCPIRPFSINNIETTVACSDIYHPVTNINVNTVFTVAKINPENGTVIDKTSFIGSNEETIFYMSKNNIYITYSYQADTVDFFLGFANENQDFLPADLLLRINKLQGYDLSSQAKLTEFQYLLQRYLNTLDRDDKLKLENEMKNRLNRYVKSHQRGLEKTGIVKIDTNNLKVSAIGEVPGKPLNQFSLDEYENNLRIAVTIGQSLWMGSINTSSESVNDVYVLNQNLDVQGSVQDLGKSEKIYSVRFIRDRGYVVTFRQTDPFYVLDLSNATNPSLKGQLKIPGYSSYLHPLTTDIILGIGKEDNQVKLSLFDVGNPEDPQEIDKYQLDEYYSEILNNHRAFLADEQNQIFFLPGNKGGYIFGYKNNQLNLVKTVSSVQAKRALYINSYLYIISNDGIVVLDEKNWERAGEIEF